MYKVVFTKNFYKSISKIDKSNQKRLVGYLDQARILRNPKSSGKPLLYNKKGNWRYRVGDYRLICKIVDKELVVLALDVGHRSKVYR